MKNACFAYFQFHYKLFDYNLSERFNKKKWKKWINECYNICGLFHYCLNDSSTRTARMPQVYENDPKSIFCLTGIFFIIFIPKRHWLFSVGEKDLRQLIHVCLHTIVSVGLKGFRHNLDCDSYDLLHLSFDSQYHNNIDQKRPVATLPPHTSLSPSFFSLSPLICLHFCSSHPVPCNLSSFKAS